MTEPTHEVTLPGAYAFQLVELVARWNVSSEALLAGSGTTIASLSDPAFSIPLSQWRQIVRRAYELTGDSALGVYMGMQWRLSWHGYLGFAAMTSATLRDSLAITEQYVGTRHMGLGLKTRVHGTEASIVLEELVPFGDIQEFMISSIFVGCAQTGAALTGHPVPGVAEVTYPEPDYYERVLPLLPGKVRFSQPTNRLIIDAKLLDLPLVAADPVAARLARAQCERELNALSDGSRMLGRVRETIAHAEGGYRSLKEVAHSMHVSARTLKRRLAASGTTFSDALVGVRRERASVLLTDQRLTIAAVAEQLGYSDVGNFTRAFKRWTGKTPAKFRKEHAP